VPSLNFLDAAGVRKHQGRVVKKIKSWVVAGLLSLSNGLVFSAAEGQAAATAKPSLTVTTTQPQSQNLTRSLLANGSLAAWQEAIIGAEAHGLKVTEVRVNVGDRVQRGDVLATLQSARSWRKLRLHWPKPRPTRKRPKPNRNAPAACSSRAFSATRN
jgi:biotin carboxyl carrier protein